MQHRSRKSEVSTTEKLNQDQTNSVNESSENNSNFEEFNVKVFGLQSDKK